jgi:DNA repair exonuclease SbcCD ATPase subunit
MGQNLNDFNNTFSKNTKELRTTLDKVNESYRGQAEVLNSIQRLRINEIATANIAVYDKLKNSTQELGELTKYLSECSSVMSKLGKYLNNSESYLIQVKELNDKLDAAEERTKTLERMGKFFEAELGEIEQRKANMTAAVGIVDNALQEALIEMQDNVKKQFSELEKSSAEQQLALENKLKETTVLIDELKNLTAVKSSMERMEKLTDEQNKRMLRIIESIENISNYGYSEPSNNYKPRLLPKWAKVLLITGGSLLSAACLLFILSVFNIL